MSPINMSPKDISPANLSIGMQTILPTRYTKWVLRDEIAPELRQTEEQGNLCLEAVSNGSAGCYGGWDIVYPVEQIGQSNADLLKGDGEFEFQIRARWHDLERGYDSIKVQLAWMDDEGNWTRDWEPIFLEAESPDRGLGPSKQTRNDFVLFKGKTRMSPKGGTSLVCRLIMAWSSTGFIQWWQPELTFIQAPPSRMWRLGATGIPHPRENNTLESNARFYLNLCHQAAEANVDILCLPEIMLQVGMPKSAADVARLAVTLPGKEIEPFQEVARSARMALCFSVWERNRELIHNTAVLIDKDGELAGKYAKVHLALPSEPWQGITPGHDFPVFALENCTIGMNICMDSSASESMRVPARRGAEVLLMPIMGDHRATSQWDGSADVFDMERWRMIHCVHAMDNQLYIVTGVNNGIGSGVFSPHGEMLACSDGTMPVVWADVDLNYNPRPWSGCTARGMLWAERREPAYAPLFEMAEPFRTMIHT